MSEDVYKRRAAREREARQLAENLLEAKSRDLYEANQSLEARSNELEVILENIASGVLMVDETGHIQHANRSARRLFEGSDSTILIGRAVDTLFDAASQAQLASGKAWSAEDVASSRNGLAVEVTALGADGHTFPAEIEIVTTADAARQVWICRDISWRRAHEEARRALELERRHLQKMEGLGTLASGIAHEINTPVQYVTDNTHFLQGTVADLLALVDQLSPALNRTGPGLTEHQRAQARALADRIDLDFLRTETMAALDQALSGLGQISKIVGAIKSFSHPGSAQDGHFALNDAVETTLAVCRHQWKHVCIPQLSLAENLPPARGQAGDFTQALLNLILNAAHALEARHGDSDADKGKLEIKTTLAGGRLCIEVADNGTGIAPDVQERIFDPFFTTKAVGEGTGQGLAITHALIVNKLGGQIEVFSTPGKGSRFVLHLACAPTSMHRQEDPS